MITKEDKDEIMQALRAMPRSVYTSEDVLMAILAAMSIQAKAKEYPYPENVHEYHG